MTAPRLPLNVNDAIRDGGIPPGCTADGLQWLEARHRDLATRSPIRSSHDLWRLRWAYTCHDLLITLLGEPRSVSGRLSRR